MIRLLGVPLSILTTACCWGIYGVVLKWGADDMGESRFRSFVCVGLAYFIVAVIVPVILLRINGEKGNWSFTGTIWSFVAGVLGAPGALGIVLALTSGGKPVFVMPLVFGGAPVINTLTTMVMTKNYKVNPLFLAGLILVIAGAALVLIFKPGTVVPAGGAGNVAEHVADWFKIISSIAMTVVCWGAYGPVLHQGQMVMQGSRLRPLICVGLAYFVIAVVLAGGIYPVLEPAGEKHSAAATVAYGWTASGFTWSLIAGAAGAVGALGIIMAFNFGGKPVYVMPLVFGGAPIVNTFFSLATAKGTLQAIGPLFYSGLFMTIIGAATVLIFAPKGGPHPVAPNPVAPTPKPAEKSEAPATETK